MNAADEPLHAFAMTERNGGQIDQVSLERLSDRELIRRFAECGDGAAFGLLVSRHGGLVFGACRRVLRHHQDAEDAFQATFLVLARKAGKVRWHRSLANWLYTTAYRVALKASGAAQKRREAPMSSEPVVEHTALDEIAKTAAWRAVDEELSQLPEKYRGPLALCYLEGKSRGQAADELGLSDVVLKGRLQRGRHELRQRLLRRGVGMSLSAASASVVILSTSAGVCWAEAASLAVPANLASATVQAATQAARGGRLSGVFGSEAVHLAKGELTMLSAMQTLKPVAAAIGIAVLGGSCVLLLNAARAERPRLSGTAIQLSLGGGSSERAAVSAQEFDDEFDGEVVENASFVAAQADPPEDRDPSADHAESNTETGSAAASSDVHAGTNDGLSDSLRAPPGERAGEDAAPTVAQVREAWDQRSKSIRSLYVDCKLKHVEKKHVPGTTNPFPDPKRGGPTVDVPLEQRLLFGFDGGRMAVKICGQHWDDQKAVVVSGSHERAFDGAVERSFGERATIPMALGHVEYRSEPGPLFTQGYVLQPFLLVIDPVAWLKRTRVFDVDEMVVNSQTAVRDGRECWELVVAHHGDCLDFLYVDPAREFVPVEFVLTRAGVTGGMIQLDYVRHDQCGWFVSSWKDALFNESGDAIASSSGIVEQYTINEAVDDSLFDVEFPTGTHVIEQRPERRKYFRQLANGELAPMREEEYGALPK